MPIYKKPEVITDLPHYSKFTNSNVFVFNIRDIFGTPCMYEICQNIYTYCQTEGDVNVPNISKCDHLKRKIGQSV